ncbi:hypothetical protein [Neisseria meningitidis]|uniref:hypothetical protein n=1 Tax=Neisseria meningitidis TaxID=487 RepID=UPI00129035F9|nr:hypothetical protein [Neisseria meningitidis]
MLKINFLIKWFVNCISFPDDGYQKKRLVLLPVWALNGVTASERSRIKKKSHAPLLRGAIYKEEGYGKT